LRARIQQEKFAADKQSLCKRLELPPEVGGAAEVFGQARLAFFGCGSNDSAIWDHPRGDSDKLGFYLDVDVRPESEIARLVWLFYRVPSPWQDDPMPSKDPTHNGALLYYALAQNDFAKIDPAALEKEAPGDYARTIILESVGVLRGRQRKYEGILEQLTRGDEDYSNILQKAPRRAFADWEKLRAEWKDELDRSDAFEKKLASPSHKVLKGCFEPLHKDAEKLIQTFKEGSYRDLVTRIGRDPVAVRLLSRLALCAGAEKIWGAGAFADLVKGSAGLRGPRSLAYQAILEAIVEAQKDRPRLVLSPQTFWYQSPRLVDLYGREFRLEDNAPDNVDGKLVRKGLVASVKKGGDGLQIVFKKQAVTWPEESCRDDVKHPKQINSSGRIEYWQICHATGKTLSQDDTPPPMTIAPELAAGVKPGAYVFGTGYIDARGTVVYVKKTGADKKLATFFGFTLQR
jgi:hypothetical protein